MNVNPQQIIDIPSSSTWGPVVSNYRDRADFSVESGVVLEVVTLLVDGKPKDFFEAVVDDRIISMICYQTHLYGTQVVVDNVDIYRARSNSRIHEWVATTNSEIRNFLSLVA